MRIFLVEDDERVVRLLERALREEGYEVDVCTRGDLALEQGLAKPYDVVLLDWNLPGADGLTVLARWREEGIAAPVIMLTARTGVDPTVSALDAGADDYIAKPFVLEELLARVRAHHRRRRPAEEQEIDVGRARVNLRRRTVTRGGEASSLSGREFALLDLLIKHRGEALDRAAILEGAWGITEDPATNVVDVYVRYLRSKLDEPGGEERGGSVIETLRGRGYRLRRQDELAR
jgi:DNA-binding response OmpR family regulator